MTLSRVHDRFRGCSLASLIELYNVCEGYLMQIALHPELDEYIEQRTRRCGYTDPSEYVSQLVETDRKTHPDQNSRTSDRPLSERLREFRRGRKLGDDLTNRDLVNEGRRI